jgi:formylglycine-generating enzyme required for sulfatase activity
MHLLKASYGQNDIFTGGRRLLRPATDNYQNLRGRGYNGTVNWPVTGSKVTSESLIGKLRERTGTEGFDLPTESEWEYACRAGGKASGFWNDGSDAGIAASTKFNTIKDGDEALGRLGRYRFNGGMVKTWDEVGQTNIYTAAATTSDESLGTAVVGSYEPNAWGLYDMHGNVGEWCNGFIAGQYYGWYSSSGYYCADQYPNLVDDPGPTSSTWGEYSERSFRGGAWNSPAVDCAIALRDNDTERQYHGIRLCWRFPTPPAEQD